jgi:hypothetical protein
MCERLGAGLRIVSEKQVFEKHQFLKYDHFLEFEKHQFLKYDQLLEFEKHQLLEFEKHQLLEFEDHHFLEFEKHQLPEFLLELKCFLHKYTLIDAIFSSFSGHSL